MKIEMMEVTLNNKTINIYPLTYINKNNSLYIVYTNAHRVDNIKDNLYVGEIKDNVIYPVIEDMIPDIEKELESIDSKIMPDMIV